MKLISSSRHVPRVYGGENNTDITIKTDAGEFWLINRNLSVRQVGQDGALSDVQDDVRAEVIKIAREQFPEDFFLNTHRVVRGPNLLKMPVRDRWYL